MDKMAVALKAAGFATCSYDYPSTSMPIKKVGQRLGRQLWREWRGRPMHAVTHSLGGIVLRHVRDDRLRWKRIVMLAPPNRGSAVAAAVSTGLAGAAFDVIYGPAGGGLAGATTGDTGWPFPPAPFAVIAGTRKRAASNPTSWFVSSRVFDDGVDHDGTVSVDETKLPGMADFATVDASHTTIMEDAAVIGMTIKFLRDGALH